jgi:uncharacterized membrane protein (DUF373 family)
MSPLLEKALKRFELAIIVTLMVLLAFMVAIGTFSLIELIVLNGPRRLNEVTDVVALQDVMQKGFGGLLVVLIGLELMDTLKHYWAGQHVRVEIVFLVGLIALGRHVIQIDYERAPLGEMVGMASVILALALGYFLVRRSGATLKKAEDGEV